VGQERLGPSHFFIPLVLGPLNSLVWYVPSLRYTRGLGWRMHCSAEVTESSTNKQNHLSLNTVTDCIGPVLVLSLGLAEVARSCRGSRRIPRSVEHQRHALHITVVLSKSAHSGPSVCLLARAPCPLRVSRPGADRAERASQAAGVSVQCKLQVLSLPCLLGFRQVLRPTFSSRTDLDERFLTLFHAQCTFLCGPYRHICVCAQSTSVFHGVY
jgi:hypothetical protein